MPVDLARALMDAGRMRVPSEVQADFSANPDRNATMRRHHDSIVGSEVQVDVGADMARRSTEVRIIHRLSIPDEVMSRSNLSHHMLDPYIHDMAHGMSQDLAKVISGTSSHHTDTAVGVVVDTKCVARAIEALAGTGGLNDVSADQRAALVSVVVGLSAMFSLGHGDFSKVLSGVKELCDQLAIESNSIIAVLSAVHDHRGAKGSLPEVPRKRNVEL